MSEIKFLRILDVFRLEMRDRGGQHYAINFQSYKNWGGHTLINNEGSYHERNAFDCNITQVAKQGGGLHEFATFSKIFFQKIDF